MYELHPPQSGFCPEAIELYRENLVHRRVLYQVRQRELDVLSRLIGIKMDNEYTLPETDPEKLVV